jgi:hypothetical protein
MKKGRTKRERPHRWNALEKKSLQIFFKVALYNQGEA